MDANHKHLITAFIDQIWNQRNFERIDDFIHPDFTDHSLLGALPPNKEGLMQWITQTSNSFEHKTIIEEIVCEADKAIIKIKMSLKHIGTWRAIEPTGKHVVASGYRYFRLAENKICEHWALIDGNAIENQLLTVHKGCKLQE